MSRGLPKICLVRHGETAWTISGQHTGRTDIPLTERANWAGFGAHAEADADLRESDYGAYEGRRTADIRAELP